MLRERFWMFCRRQVRSAILSIAFGAVFSMIFSIGKAHGWELVYTTGVGAVIGVAIWICIAVLESLFQPAIDRLPERFRQVAHGLLFLVAGIMGWFSGVLLAHLIFGRAIDLRSLVTSSALPFILITGGLVVAVGLVFRAFEIMRDRLAESIVQLKETEWTRKEIEWPARFRRGFFRHNESKVTAFQSQPGTSRLISWPVTFTTSCNWTTVLSRSSWPMSPAKAWARA